MDIQAIRQQTPACENLTHLNNAGASLQPLIVQDTVLNYLRIEAEKGGYETADRFSEQIEGYYTAIAHLLNAQPHQIAWAASATDGFARVLSVFDWKPGDVILTTQNDYVSSQIAFMALRDRYGVRVVHAREHELGGVDVADMEQKMDEFRPKLVAVTHIPTNSGLVQPIEAIGRACRARQLWYIVDACQSVGQLPLDVTAIGCDFLTATCRKYLRGPRGAGLMWASDRALHEPSFFMQVPDMIGGIWTEANTWQHEPTARRFEYFEQPIALKLGTAAAAQYFMDVGPNWASQRICALAAQLRQMLAQIKGVRILDHGQSLCGIVTFYHPAFEGIKVQHWMRNRQLNCSVSPRYVAVIDFDQKQVDAALRFSVHYYNTEAELERAVALVAEYLGV